MADGTHHGSLNDAAPAQGAALTPGQDLPGDLAALDLQQLMGLDVIVVDPLTGGSSLPGEDDTPADLMDLDLDQLMGLDVVRDAPLPRSNTDTFNPLPRKAEGDTAPNGVSTPPAALSAAPSPIPAAIVGAPGEGTVIEDVLADILVADTAPSLDDVGLDDPGTNPRDDGQAGPQGEEASLDLVGLDLETLMDIAVGGIGQIEDIANEGVASLDGGAEFDVFDLGALAPALGQPLSQFSAGLTGETTGTSPVVESDDTGSGGDTTTTTTDPGTPTPPTPPNDAPTVTLAAQDVLDMSDTDTVTITGDAGDSLQAGTGWTDGGISGGFHTYTQGLATLLVDTDVTVNGDITA